VRSRNTYNHRADNRQRVFENGLIMVFAVVQDAIWFQTALHLRRTFWEQTSQFVGQIKSIPYSVVDCMSVMWDIDPLLGNDSEISDCTTTVAKQRLHKQAWSNGNNCTAIEKGCFLCGPCWDIISRTSYWPIR
jgi:hypothetical protein